MTKRAALTGVVLIALGLSVFLWKVVGLGTPLLPSEATDLWQVELTVSARGTGERGSIRVALPSSDEGQTIYDERASSDRLQLSIRSKKGEGRTGVWTGTFSGVHRVVYGFRVRLLGIEPKLPTGKVEPLPAELLRQHGGASVDYPTGADEVKELLERLALPPMSDPAGRLRALHAYVVDEVALVQTASGDALLTLSQAEGSALGKARLLVTLLRAAGIPARIATGLRLREGVAPEGQVFVEAWLGSWLPLSPAGEFFGGRPKDLLVLGSGSGDVVEVTGVSAVGQKFRSRRERLRPEELAAMMAPASEVLSALSLYRLPLGTQESLRLLLLLPLGALFVSLWRNLVGIPTYGTFLPVLLALSLRATGLSLGLLLVALVLGVGVFGRILVDRLRLLVVPRLSVLLCLVVLCLTGVALAGEGSRTPGLFAGIFFPVVILTMLIERFSLTLAEEGPRSALFKAGYTTLVSVGTYPVLKSETVTHLMFGFPELVIVIMGLLTFLGGYTGYRLMDLWRFRSFARGG